MENRRASNEEEISNNEINNKITKPKIKKKNNKIRNLNIDNKYHKLYEHVMNKQKEYKNNSNININIYNPIDEKLKANKLSLFIEYKNLYNINYNNKKEENKVNCKSFNTMNNIDYFLSKEKKMKDSIFLIYKNEYK